MTSENADALAGPTQPPVAPEPDTAREVFPVVFEKDYGFDFTVDARSVDETDGEIGVPKSSSAPVSVATPALPTGLEDVSPEDLDKTVQTSAAKDKSQPTTTPTEPGTPTSSEETSTGKSKRSAQK